MSFPLSYLVPIWSLSSNPWIFNFRHMFKGRDFLTHKNDAAEHLHGHCPSTKPTGHAAVRSAWTRRWSAWRSPSPPRRPVRVRFESAGSFNRFGGRGFSACPTSHPFFGEGKPLLKNRRRKRKGYPSLSSQIWRTSVPLLWYTSPNGELGLEGLVVSQKWVPTPLNRCR